MYLVVYQLSCLRLTKFEIILFNRRWSLLWWTVVLIQTVHCLFLYFWMNYPAGVLQFIFIWESCWFPVRQTFVKLLIVRSIVYVLYSWFQLFSSTTDILSNHKLYKTQSLEALANLKSNQQNTTFRTDRRHGMQNIGNVKNNWSHNILFELLISKDKQTDNSWGTTVKIMAKQKGLNFHLIPVLIETSFLHPYCEIVFY